MKGLILAAGLGSRLKGYTSQIPKALVRINGRPILSYQIDALLINEVEDIYIVIGYKGKEIINYINKNYKDINVTFINNKEYNTSNSSYSFWLAHKYLLESSYIHLNCDIIISPIVIKLIIESQYDNVICIKTDDELTDNMELVKLEKNTIVKMDNSYFDEAIGKAYGVAKFSDKSTFLLSLKVEEYIKSGDKNQNYYGLIRQAIFELNYNVIDCTDEILFETNTVSDLKKVEKLIINHEKI